MPLFFLGTREWRNRQTRTVQVRVPVMEWGFNSPLAHDEAADPTGSAVFVLPGCCCGVAAPDLLCCLWPHGCSGRRRARPPARLGPHFVRRRASKPARALRSLRRPPHLWGRAAWCARGRRPARSPSAQIRPLARGRRWPRRGRLRALRVRPLGCGSRGDLEGPRDTEVAPLAQEVIMPREGKRAEHVRQPLQLDYWSAITV